MLALDVQAFDALFSLVGKQTGVLGQLSMEETPNEELPSTLTIWLDLVDLLQVRQCKSLCAVNSSG